MRKIKILVDAHVFDGAYQGTTTYIKGLYSSLVNDETFDITLTAYDVENLKQHFPDQRFHFIALPSPSKLKRLLFSIPSIIRAGSFDFAHFQYITPPTKKCRYINTIHDLLFMDFSRYFPFRYRFINKNLFRFSAWRSDVICTVSEYSKKALSCHFRISETDITLTPNAVEPYAGDYTDVKKKHNIGNYLLFVSRMEPRKNHYLMLRSFVELNLYNEGYHLVFIGRMKDLEALEFNSYYHHLSPAVKQKVLMLDNVSAGELNSFYKMAALFVYPSLAEGFGIPPLEAAMNDCKVLCSNQTAMKDFDFFGKYLFNPNQAEELKTKIITTLADSDYPYDKIKSAIAEKYNWETIAKVFAARLKSESQET